MVSKLAQTWVKENSMPLGAEKAALFGAAGVAGGLDCEVLVVGGGGGGAGQDRQFLGGGGGGGIVHSSSYTCDSGVAYDLTVGAGGASNTAGADSVFNVNSEGSVTTTLPAKGGGFGGRQGVAPSVGGCGGGGAGTGGTTYSNGADSNQTTGSIGGVATGYGGTGENAEEGGGAEDSIG